MFFLVIASNTSMVHLSQVRNQYRLLVTKLHTLFRCPQFSPNVPFLFQDLIQDTTSHLLVVSPWATPGCDNLSEFSVFDNLDDLREYYSSASP